MSFLKFDIKIEKKRFNFYFYVFSFLFLIFFLNHCSDDNCGSDPEGTVQVNIKNGHYGGDLFTPNSFFNGFGISVNNQFWGQFYDFIEVGKTNGIGGITQFPDKPITYWNFNVDVKKGHGYIGAYKTNPEIRQNIRVTYFRLYVENLIKNSGDITGATLKFHSPFKPKQVGTIINVDKSEIVVPLSLDISVTHGFITIIDPVLSWTAVSSEEWCQIWAGNRNSIAFSVPRCCSNQEEFNSIAGKTATITIKIDGFQDKIITIKISDK